MNASSRQIAIWGFFAFSLSLFPLFLLQIHGAPGAPIHAFTDDSILIWNLLDALIRGDVVPFVSMKLPRMAAPHSPLVFSEGFPITEQLQFAVLKALSFFEKDPIRLGDLYFLLGYPLTALAFFSSAISLGIHAPIAFGLSFAFTYLPYHWIRYDHLFLSHYWVLAPAAALLLRSTTAKFDSFRSQIGVIGFSFLITLWHSYYGFFFFGVLALVLAVRFVREKAFSRRALGLAIGLGIGFGAAIGVSTLHYFVARAEARDAPARFSRPRGDARVYRLRPAAVLLPVENHRIRLFAELREEYKRRVPFREGLNESLGTLGLLGVIYGLYRLIEALRKKTKPDPISRAGMVQALVFFFSGSVGIAVALSYLVNSVFRSPNRISPMLGAVALFVVGFFLSRRFPSVTRRDRLKLATVGILLALFAVWDQVPSVPRDPKPAEDVATARRFVAEIESIVGDGAVLQLPAAGFPEWPTLHRMPDYAHSIGPLFSEKTRFSYGVWKNTKSFSEIEELSRPPLALDRIREFGYSGIWIDRWGSFDDGKSIVEELKTKLRRDPIVSEDGRWVFFSIR